MTITTTANAHKGSETYSSVKLPGADLRLLAQSESGETLGTLTVTRNEEADETVFTMETTGRGRAVREWLNVDGLNKADIPRNKKQTEKKYGRARADLQFLPRGIAAYFLNSADNLRFKDLNVLLEPSE
ncbi:hypothetical protein HZB58_00285 [Candidatus Gottesmanbacteria bacterium]|nr:hypothetical protein [Candidatus Gottesmanbacteria bacterium]